MRNDDGGRQSAACHENWNASSENVAKVMRLPHKTTFDAKRSNVTFETSKSDPFCRTYHRHGHTGLARTVADGCERLRTVANGCKRLQTVANINTTSREHSLNPQTPRVKREPLLRIREKTMCTIHTYINICAMFKTYYTGDGHPSHHGNPIILGI